MMRRRRYAKYPPAAGAAGSDTDALQTDVMRFMSIIGLCLMAVFALVQGVPVPENSKPVQASQAARIRQEASAQQQQVQELQIELRALKTEKDRTQQLLLAAQQNIEQLAMQSQQVREQYDKLESQLEGLGQRLEQVRKELADIKLSSLQREQDLDGLRRRLLATHGLLNSSRKEIETIKHRLESEQSRPVSEPALSPKPEVKPVPVKQGFTLRFASDAALDRLVAAGSVILFGMADDQAWRLSMTAGRTAIAQVSLPGWFHEMSAVTVPAHYIQRMDSVADSPGRSAVVWGVQLPPATRATITALARGRPGGTLVIRDNGQVVLEE